MRCQYRDHQSPASKINGRLTMKYINTGCVIGYSALAMFLAMQSTVMAQNYKCKGTDGKIEYSDRPCDNSKEVLSKPRSATGTISSPGVVPMMLLETLFADYEPRLCEREKLATDVDMAQRSGELKTAEAVWKPKQERLNFLNDTLVEFQEKAGKVTKGTASDSPEMMVVRKFQRKLKDCGQIKK